MSRFNCRKITLSTRFVDGTRLIRGKHLKSLNNPVRLRPARLVYLFAEVADESSQSVSTAYSSKRAARGARATGEDFTRVEVPGQSQLRLINLFLLI